MESSVAPPPSTPPAQARPSPNRTKFEFRGKKAKTEFQEKLQRAQIQQLLDIETVRLGLRRCATVSNVAPDQVDDLRAKYAQMGLAMVVDQALIREVQPHPEARRSAPQPPRRTFTCIVAKQPSDLDEFVRATTQPDCHLAQGALLGYPECCCTFFHQRWQAGCTDPTWETAANTTGDLVKIRETQHLKGEPLTRLVVLGADETCFPLSAAFRAVGLRLIPHFPCSANCPASVKMAADRIALAREQKIPGIDDLLEFLRLPYEWACNEGRATVTTPYFVIVANATRYKSCHILRQEGWI